MASVIRTMTKKKARATLLRSPSLVPSAAAWARANSSMWGAWGSMRVPPGSVKGEGLLPQLRLQPVDLGVVLRVGPGHVERGEEERDHDDADAEGDGARRDLADFRLHELGCVRD